MKKKQDKPVTEEKLGQMLNKYISPVYDEIKEIKQNAKNFEKKVDARFDKVEGKVDRLESKTDEIIVIQLKMEHKLTEQIKTVYDREDHHGKMLKNHALM